MNIYIENRITKALSKNENVLWHCNEKSYGILCQATKSSILLVIHTFNMALLVTHGQSLLA